MTSYSFLVKIDDNLRGCFAMAIFLDKLRDKIKMYNYYKERDDLLRKSIANIGEIIEYEDKIVCNVSQVFIDEYKNKLLELNGMCLIDEDNKKVLDSYNLNKPVYYIFDGLKFYPGFNFCSRWANVIFKNCIFDKGISIQWADNVIFENNTYLDYYSGYYYGGDCFLWGRNIIKLTLINDNFVNSEKRNHPTKFGISLEVGTLEIINSEINCKYPGSINIEAEKAIINDSFIDVDELCLDSDSIDFSDSFIIANTSVDIKNKDNDFIGYIEAPVVVYNGVDLANKNGEMCKVDFEERMFKELKIKLLSILNSKIVNDDKDLMNARRMLLGKLYNISENCEMMNEKRLQSIRDNLDRQPVSRALRREDSKY